MAIVVIGAVAVVAWPEGGGKNNDKTEQSRLANFAQCLTDKGWAMYGMDSCPHCVDQKQAFGNAWRYIEYVECRQEPQRCNQADVQVTPTWVGGEGQRVRGFQPLSELSQLSGCPLERVDRGRQNSVMNSQNIQQVQINGTRINVEIAADRQEQKQGLSGKQELAWDSGMLFVYEEPQNPGFWMKDMNFPIDIIWIGPEKRVVDVTKNISPDTYPKTFHSSEPAQYVLEVNAGFAHQSGINIGDRVEFLKNE